jgi:hypothetical protein
MKFQLLTLEKMLIKAYSDNMNNLPSKIMLTPMVIVCNYHYLFRSWCPTADCKHVFFYTEEDDSRF